MIVAIHQPNYMPWLGYFYKIARADRFVFLDDAQFSKNSVINRTAVAMNGERRWLSVPVRVHLGQNIMETQVAEEFWQHKHLGALSSYYRKAPAFNKVWSDIEGLFEGLPTSNLAGINMALVQRICSKLDLSCEFMCSSQFPVRCGKGDDALIELMQMVAPGGSYFSGRGAAKYQNPEKFAVNGFRLVYSDFQHPIYSQHSSQFEMGLSILDAIFNVGWAATASFLTPQKGTA